LTGRGEKFKKIFGGGEKILLALEGGEKESPLHLGARKGEGGRGRIRLLPDGDLERRKRGSSLAR